MRIELDESTLDLVRRSFSSRLVTMFTRADARSLLEDIDKIPRTLTRRGLKQAIGLELDGVMGTISEKSVFVRAFQNRRPKLVKIPKDPEVTHLEGRVYAELGQEALRYRLVPVEYVCLDQSISVVKGARALEIESYQLTGGLLMPLYFCSLSEYPIPMDPAHVSSSSFFFVFFFCCVVSPPLYHV
jgi:hypothetical protein